MSLSPAELSRYNRHLKLPGFGIEAQDKLKNTSVLLIGAGGLGCPIGLYLAAAGIGKLTVVDFDVIEINNLQRQVAHKSCDAGLPKAPSLAQRMTDLNPEIDVEVIHARLDEQKILELFPRFDLIIDGTDNYPTRYLIADACYFLKKPLVYGAIHQFDAQLSVFDTSVGPCYRCLFPVPPQPGQTPSCSEAGVLGVLPGTVGLMMATEALKFLTGIGTTMVGTLVLYSALDQSLRHIKLGRDRKCPLCGDYPTIKGLAEIEFICDLPKVPSIDVATANQRFSGDELLIIDVREPSEWGIGHIPGAQHIPLGSFTQERIANVNKEQQIIVYCHKGGRSLKAVEQLLSWGYDHSLNMEGGIVAWAKSFDQDLAKLLS